ncbi:MAG: glycosyltransferase family 4 protein [Clostridia bacterium]|nr:glycosyltransferase family 4 protein [Clostridia bacterium]
MPQKKENKKRAYHLTSATCTVEEYDRVIIKEEYKTAQAGIKFFRVFLDGFAKNGEKITVFSKRPTTRVKSGKRYIPSKNEEKDGVRYHYCRLFNFPVVNNVYSYLAAFFWYMNPKKCAKGDLVFVDPLNVSIAAGTMAACKLRGIPTVAFITDLPTCYCYAGEKPSAHLRASQRVNQRADGYVNVTKYIDGVINPKGKPSVVMEGFVSESLREMSVAIEDKYPKKVCMYTGAMEKIYGLDMLVEGFLKADIPDSELHLYGAGGYVDEIKRLAEGDDRIKYFGCRDNAYVVDAQMKATLLINPRYSDAEYTKYSFPGKNLEYAASGTPTLTTPLPGMPEEYYPHVFILEEETVDGMAKKLTEILSTPREELYEFGLATKAWMLDNKNCRTQIRRAIDFFNSVKLK